VNLTLAPGILEEIIEHAKKSHPNEGCGLLAGRQSANRFIPMTNVSAVPAKQYEIDPVELIRTLRDLRNNGEELIAIYHSHPHGPAEPSRTDIERAYYPEAAQLIVSLADLERPRTAAFRIAGGEVLPIEVHVIV
jgi:proteasome lid subunit RPN8/RPN11